MADKKLPNLNEDQINHEEKDQRDKIIKEINSKLQTNFPCEDVPGPSASTNLPGAVPLVHRNNLQKSVGLSKSEHNLGKATSKDIVNALKLTSISYNTAKGPKVIPVTEVKGPKVIPVTEVKVPINDEEVEIKNDIGFVDIKSFMATSFKINLNGEVTKEPVKNVNAAISTIDMDTINAQANTSCLTSTAQTDEPINKVTVTGETGMEAKESKMSDKSKASRNISEKDYSMGQRDSLSSIGSNVCRICMTRGRERLISPCNCKGSLANVHLTCLERWLNQVGRNHCELCGFSYPAIRTPRYTVLQALRLWFANPRNRSHLQSDCLIFWLLSTVTAGLLAVCIVGTRYFVMEGSRMGKPDQFRKDAISHRITETAMDFFMGIVLCGYTVTVYLLWKDHYVMWNRWRRANVNVRLLLAPDTNPVPFVPRARYHVL